VKSHKDLQVWRSSIELARLVYRVTSEFGREEQFGLTTQMRRASVSIASNIAEGAARSGTKEFVQFLYIASGSASELQTQVEIAKGLFDEKRAKLETLQRDAESLSRMIHGLIRSLKSRGAKRDT
jgi:four helix bundle protein